jgi:hypothetical protein
VEIYVRLEAMRDVVVVMCARLQDELLSNEVNQKTRKSVMRS